jgi:hypothetical protein
MPTSVLEAAVYTEGDGVIDWHHCISGRNMPNDNFKKLYVDELKDLYSVENQLVKTTPQNGPKPLLRKNSAQALKHIWNRPLATFNDLRPSFNL